METTGTTSAMGAVKNHLIGEENSNQSPIVDTKKDEQNEVAESATESSKGESNTNNIKKVVLVDNEASATDEKEIEQKPKTRLLKLLTEQHDVIMKWSDIAGEFYRKHERALNEFISAFEGSYFNDDFNVLIDFMKKEVQKRINEEERVFKIRKFLENYQLPEDTGSYMVLIPYNDHQLRNNIDGYIITMTKGDQENHMKDYRDSLYGLLYSGMHDSETGLIESNIRTSRMASSFEEMRYIIPSKMSSKLGLRPESMAKSEVPTAHLAIMCATASDLESETDLKIIGDYMAKGCKLCTYGQFTTDIAAFVINATNIKNCMSWWDKYVRYRRPYHTLKEYIKIVEATIVE